MNSLFKTSGILALVACAISVSSSEAQAGGRRHCHYQQTYAAPAMTYSTGAPVVAESNTTVDGHQRYQSAYQAPANGPYAPVYMAPAQTYYNGNGYGNAYQHRYRPLHFQDRTFEQQNSADRKILGL